MADSTIERFLTASGCLDLLWSSCERVVGGYLDVLGSAVQAALLADIEADLVAITTWSRTGRSALLYK
jgi:hypothetical protein